jgi:hypothetical protein
MVLAVQIEQIMLALRLLVFGLINPFLHESLQANFILAISCAVN